MKYNYEVVSYYNNAREIVETSDIDVIFNKLSQCIEDNTHCDIVNAETGEILAWINSPNEEDNIPDLWFFAFYGWAVANGMEPMFKNNPEPEEESKTGSYVVSAEDPEYGNILSYLDTEKEAQTLIKDLLNDGWEVINFKMGEKS